MVDQIKNLFTIENIKYVKLLLEVIKHTVKEIYCSEQELKIEINVKDIGKSADIKKVIPVCKEWEED